MRNNTNATMVVHDVRVLSSRLVVLLLRDDDGVETRALHQCANSRVLRRQFASELLRAAVRGELCHGVALELRSDETQTVKG